jgi:glyoxylase-like metal-dependent hydrolase (beta-lactamase superfamily II)
MVVLKKIAGAAPLLAAAWLLAGPVRADDAAQAALQKASKALGVDSLQSIEFSGAGVDYALGQAPNVKSPWPKFNDKSYDRTVNFAPWATRLQRVRTQAENPPRGGGGQPIVGEQNQTQVVTVASPNAVSLPNELAVTLPQAFLKAATTAGDLTARQAHDGAGRYTVLSFTALNQARTSGWIDEHGEVTRVETRIDNPVLGDTLYQADFSGYRDFGGMRFPAHIVQHAGGYPVLDLQVAEVKVNPPADIADNPAPAAAALNSEPLGDGVYLIGGGYAAVAVAFKDHVVVIEGGQNDQRSQAVIAEAKRLIPGKPITAVVNTHAHFDHSGGLRAYVAEGATVITQAGNKAWFQKVWANPHKLAPDALALHPRPAKFELVKDHLRLSDGEQVVELYHLHDFGHNDAALVAYLPRQKVLVEADAFNPPPAPVAQTPAAINPSQQSLAENIDRLHLDVQRIVPIHLPADNRKVTLDELNKAIGKG